MSATTIKAGMKCDTSNTIRGLMIIEWTPLPRWIEGRSV